MKPITIAAAAVLGVIGALVVAVMLLPSPWIESSYPTLDVGRRDQLFARGWLPDVLPPSSRQIRLLNNLDLNTSEGSFEFDATEWRRLEANLAPGLLTAPFVQWETRAAQRRGRGYSAWHYLDAPTRWVFFCKPAQGECEYVMWDAP